MSKQTTVAHIAAQAPELAKHIQRNSNKTECMKAFEAWAMDQGFRGINPESLSAGLLCRQDALTEQERAGLRFWINDFRALFFG